MMDFGAAVQHMEVGYRVARAGWNGKGMWIALSAPSPRVVPYEMLWSEQARAWAAEPEQGYHATVLPFFIMKTATNELLFGWLASQSDMLARDWDIVE